MTNPTDEQIADTLVRAGVLHDAGYAFHLVGGTAFYTSAEQAIADGNVAMAAWAALESTGGYIIGAHSKLCDGSGGYVAEAMSGSGKHHLTKICNDRATAITTACAMALRELEKGSE